jgi:hypothetical protein
MSTLPQADDNLNDVQPNKRIGGPRIEHRHLTNEAQKPWVALGMSKRTRYRRQAEGEETMKRRDQNVNSAVSEDLFTYGYRLFTPDEDALIRSDYAANVPIAEIAHKLNRRRDSVRNRIRLLRLYSAVNEDALAYRRRTFTPDEDALIRKDYAAYVSITEIARKLNRSYSAIRQRTYLLRLVRSGAISQVLQWAPPHLRAQLGQIPDQAFLDACHLWRDQQRRFALNAAYVARSRIIQEKCAAIDAIPGLPRRAKMLAKRLAGATLQEVGNQHGVTREYVRQVTAQPTVREKAKGKRIGRLPSQPSKKMRRLATRHSALVDAEFRHLLKAWRLALPEVKARFLCALQPDNPPDHEHPLDVPAATAEHVQSNDGSALSATPEGDKQQEGDDACNPY